MGPVRVLTSLPTPFVLALDAGAASARALKGLPPLAHQTAGEGTLSSDQGSGWMGLAAVLVLLGGIFLWSGLRAVRLDRESLLWPSTDGYIESSEKVISPTREGKQFIHNFVYRYSVGGVQFTGNQIVFGGDNRPIETLTNRYPAGSVVTVYFNPTKHGEAVLEPGAEVGLAIGPRVGMAFTAVGLIIAAIAY